MIRISTVILVTIAFCFLFQTPAVTAKSKKLTEHDFILGEPDKSVSFPDDAFAQAKVFQKEKSLEEAEDLLITNLENARVAGRGTSKLGKYLIRLNNVLFARGKDKQAIKYGEIGVKLIALDLKNRDALIGWLVNGQSYLAMSLDRLKKYDKAIEQYNEVIELAESAPKGKVSAQWIKTLKQQKQSAIEKSKGKK